MDAVLEVALGLGFVFLVFSTVTTALVEWISAFGERRFRQLHASLVSTLGDSLTDRLLAHPVVAGLPSPRAARRGAPSYVSQRSFSLALAAIAREAKAKGRSDRRLEQLMNSLRSDLRSSAAADTDDGDSLKFDAEMLFRVERWFKEQMDRGTGLYKRWTLVWTIAVATVLTVGFDLDAGRIAAELHRNAALRAVLAARAGDAVEGRTAADPQVSLDLLKGLPIGWSSGFGARLAGHAWAFVSALAGWAVSIVAISLGAPFWFDLLNRFKVGVRQTGPRPAELERES